MTSPVLSSRMTRSPSLLSPLPIELSRKTMVPAKSGKLSLNLSVAAIMAKPSGGRVSGGTRSLLWLSLILQPPRCMVPVVRLKISTHSKAASGPL